jgi:hypothetical protein
MKSKNKMLKTGWNYYTAVYMETWDTIPLRKQAVAINPTKIKVRKLPKQGLIQRIKGIWK